MDKLSGINSDSKLIESIVFFKEEFKKNHFKEKLKDLDLQKIQTLLTVCFDHLSVDQKTKDQKAAEFYTDVLNLEKEIGLVLDEMKDPSPQEAIYFVKMQKILAYCGLRKLSRDLRMQILCQLPGNVDEQKHSLQVIQKFEGKDATWYRRVLAEWINFHHISIKQLGLSFKKICELSDHLTYLDLSGCQNIDFEKIDWKSTFPKLVRLVISDSDVKQLSNFPDSLRELNVSYCHSLRSIVLPAGLQEFDCSHCNQLDPFCLPLNLKRFFCSACHLWEEFKSILPVSLEEFDCSGCSKVTHLLDLPISLRRLFCYLCANLESLSLPPLLQVVDANGCPSLVKITNVPVTMQDFNSSDCAKLSQIFGSLEKVGKVNIDKCPVSARR